MGLRMRRWNWKPCLLYGYGSCVTHAHSDELESEEGWEWMGMTVDVREEEYLLTIRESEC